MTDEELKKEAGEYASINARQYCHNDANGLISSYHEVYNAYYQSAEPREKRIAELEERISNQGESFRVIMLEEEKKGKRIAELEAQIEKMKAELHHRLVSTSHDDSDCLDKIIGLDRLWQFGQEF